MRDHGPDDQTTGDPHTGHDGTEEKSEGLPFFLKVATWELNASKDKLYAEDKTAEVECDGIEICLRAGVF